ncbi:hypothetical protein N752_30040 [Desulforamulus aquiferis]|nr:hypothetical protein N752_30040 [Desulforamulus aquiferis]
MVHNFKLAPLDKQGKFMASPLMLILAICTLCIIWLGPFLFSPRSYQISPKGIVIRLRITKK